RRLCGLRVLRGLRRIHRGRVSRRRRAAAHQRRRRRMRGDAHPLAIVGLGEGALPVIRRRSILTGLGAALAGLSLVAFPAHPSPAYAHVQIGLRADSLVWFDPVAGLRVRGWKLPFRPVGIGLGEGNTSLDGRFLALANHDSIVIVDMDPQPPLASYAEGNRRIGPIYAVAPCSLDVAAPDKFTMGN